MKMTKFAVATCLAVAAISSAYAQAQSDSVGITRADVKQELRALQIAGFDPTATINYSQSLAAAEDKVAAQRDAAVSEPALLEARLR